MPASVPVRRVVLVVLDGLRPDAIPRFGLPHLSALVRRGASTMLGRTVSPSVTACAMASLLTGATPAQHGLQGDRFHLPRSRGPLHPLPRTLAAHGIRSEAYLAAVPVLFAGVARRIAAHLGWSATRFRGRNCHDIAAVARPAIKARTPGLILQHWPDADRAGHGHGWMSEAYACAAWEMDAALGQLVADVGLDDPGTIVVALADHGGGGATARHHYSDHLLDTTIPIVLAGGSVEPGELAAGTSLLDVPATACWALGVPLPASFAGRPLVEAFRTAVAVAAA